MMEVSHLTRRFAGRTAVEDLSFEAREGEILGMIGPNGCGKTTTARLLAGVLEPTAGRIRLYGRDPHRDSLEYRRLVGYLPEAAPAWGELRVREQLMLWGAVQGLSLRRCLQQMEWVLDVCALNSCLERRIETLSRGFRQRVGLAMALLANPPVLILDEPTAGLDSAQAAGIRKTVKMLQNGRMIVFATHCLEEAEALCHRILVLQEGRLVVSGTPDVLKSLAGGGESVYAEIRGPKEAVCARCEALLFVEAVEVTGNGEWLRIILRHRPGSDIRADLYRLAVREGWELRELRAVRPDIHRAITLVLGGSA